MTREDKVWRARAAAAEKVWRDLSVLVGCSSPDGSAELEQVRYYQERSDTLEELQALVAEHDKLQIQIRMVQEKFGRWGGRI